ncbi:MAG TPA: patatin-like phospholipase family protein [Burkholderiales bacterium]|nr:patatin-like phospholipase family protein [Burkholderiales bacterium]
MDAQIAKPKVGLILTGGGARAAYQVGVLRAISNLLPKNAANPFPIICGSSAGAINAAALAINAGNFRAGIGRLVAVWRNFHAHQVYRSDPVGVMNSGARWLAALMVGGLGKHNPTSLLDNSPLAELLRHKLEFKGIQESIDRGALYALSITASGYASGESVTFYQAVPTMSPWRRARRLGIPTQIGLEHLLASSAIPFMFSAVKINREYFGDGSMRQVAPISPALHLGAERVLVVGVTQAEQPNRVKGGDYPSLAEIAGHALNSIFLDGLEVDLERLQRINKTIQLVPSHALEKSGLSLRHVDVLVISPSESIESIAQKHVRALPRSIRFLLHGVGATRRSGANLLSYLLFEKPFCRELIDLGYKDAMGRKQEILEFLREAATAVNV